MTKEDTKKEFLPDWYEPPKTWWVFMKLQPGNNKIRILSSAIVWYEYFTTEKKPKRFKMKDKPDGKPQDIHPNSSVRHFWAFAVYNYASEKIEILQIAQRSIQNWIKDYIDEEEYWNPRLYDLKIKKDGENLETKYSVVWLPPKKFHDENVLNEAKEIKIEELFEFVKVNVDNETGEIIEKKQEWNTLLNLLEKHRLLWWDDAAMKKKIQEDNNVLASKDLTEEQLIQVISMLNSEIEILEANKEPSK